MTITSWHFSPSCPSPRSLRRWQRYRCSCAASPLVVDEAMARVWDRIVRYLSYSIRNPEAPMGWPKHLSSLFGWQGMLPARFHEPCRSSPTVQPPFEVCRSSMVTGSDVRFLTGHYTTLCHRRKMVAVPVIVAHLFTDAENWSCNAPPANRGTGGTPDNARCNHPLLHFSRRRNINRVHRIPDKGTCPTAFLTSRE